MKITVLGKTGQVARELARANHAADQTTFLGRDEANFLNPYQTVAAIEASAPDAIICAAAYTAVDAAEADEEIATQINGRTVGDIARWAAKRGTPLIHISSDYVFDGAGNHPRAPDDPVAPLSAYGRSKLAGEVEITKAGGPHAIVRTSWVFSAHGNNFVKTMLRLGSERQALSIVADQIGGPTAASDCAQAVLVIARRLTADPALSGIYHYAGAPDVSWADFARAVFKVAGLEVEVTGIPTKAYPTPARRPLNSRLDCASTKAVFGLPQPDWRTALAHVITELKESTD